MAEEQIAPAEVETNANIAPNIDSELDAALSKSFGSNISKSDGTAPEKVEKNIDEPKREIKPEVKIDEKKDLIEDKSLPDPESLQQTPPGKASAASKDGWNALRNNYKKAHQIAQDKDVEISKLKALIADKSSASQKELDAIKAEKVELEKYRAMVDIQADPEFISKYDQPIEKAVIGIKDMIKGLGVSQEVVDAIDFKDPARLEQVIDLISQNKDRFTASKIERKIKDYLELSDKRNETLSEQQKTYKETLEKRKQENFSKQSEGEGRMIKHIELKSNEKGADGKPLLPFLTKIQPKENATQTEIDQAGNHNSLVDAMNNKLKQVLQMREPEQQAEIAIAAVASHWLMSSLKATQAELVKAREELAKVANITSETSTRKPAPIARNGNGTYAKGEYVDHETALNQFFKR